MSYGQPPKIESCNIRFPSDQSLVPSLVKVFEQMLPPKLCLSDYDEWAANVKANARIAPREDWPE